MKNPLRKRLFRELKSDFGKYAALFLFLTFTIGFVSGFLVSDNSLKSAYDNSFEAYNIEDGHFVLAAEATEEIIEKVEEENVTVDELFYKDFKLENEHTCRLYKAREKVNKICLMEGSMPKKNGEIVIDRLYAQNNNIEIGDTFKVDEKFYKVTGYAAFPDYSCLFKNNTDMMFDANKFTVAIVTDEDFDNSKDSAVKYCYTWDNKENLSDKNSSEKGDDIMDSLIETGLLIDFVKRSDNMAINFTGDDMGSDKVMIITLLYIIMAVLAFIVAITTRNTIEKEAGAIGTLRASGYTRGEMLRHYIVLPTVVTLIAAVIGNICGYTFMKNIMAALYYNSYSLTTYKTLWNVDAFIMTTVIPVIIIFVINVVVISTLLRLPPLQFLRRELKKNKKKIAIALPNFKFMTRFRIRIIIQNMSAYFTLFLGILFASVLLMFGLMMAPLLSEFKASVVDSKIADYQYILKGPVETQYESAEKYAVTSLENENGEEITIYGVDENSKFINISGLSYGKVYASSGIIDKYGISVGDTIDLKEQYAADEYTFEVGGDYEYPATMAIFMTKEYFNEVFEFDREHYNGYLSDKKLDDIDEKYVASIITEADLTVIADQLEDSMGQMFWLICIFAILIYMLIIYLLAKQVVEKNAHSISMIKILGYNDSEAGSLYNISTAIVVVLSLMISLPVCFVLIKYIYVAMMFEYNGWLTFYIAPWIYPAMVLAGVACYGIVHVFQFRRIKKIPMSDALKNNE